MPVVERVISHMQENLAASLLQQAQTAWATSPNEDGAEKVAELLSHMPVGTPSSAGAQKLVKQIEARLKTLDQRKWAALNRELARNHQERMATIKAARDVAVAYAKTSCTHTSKSVYLVIHITTTTIEGASLSDTPSIIYTERFLREVMVWRKYNARCNAQDGHRLSLGDAMWR